MSQDLQILAKVAVRSARRSPRVAASMATLAIQLYQQQEYHLLLDVADVMVSKTQTPFSFTIRAATYIALNKLDLAINDTNEALKKDRDFALAYLLRSEAKRINGDIKGAELDRIEFEERYALDETGQFHELINQFISALQGDADAMYQLSSREAKVSLHETANLITPSDIDLLPDVLVGRENELKNIWAKLTEEETIIITGLGGIGKTTLAHQLVRRWLTQSAGIVLWIKFEPDSTLPSLCDTIGRATDNEDIFKAVSHDEKILNTANYLSQQEELLVVLDDVWLPKVARDFCKQIIPDNVPVLITSRMIIHELGSVHQLEELSYDDATKLFKESAKHEDLSDEHLRDLLIALDNHPLAIKLAAKSDLTSQELLERFVLPMPSLTSRNEETVEPGFKLWSVLTVSYESLDTDCQNVLMLLGASPAKSLGVELASLTLKLTRDRVQEIFDKLLQYSLTQNLEPERVSVHDTVWSFVRALAKDKNKFNSLTQLLQAYVSEFCSRHNSAAKEDYDALEAELGNILGIVAQAALEEEHDIVNKLAFNLVEGEFLYTRGYYQQAEEILSIAIDSAIVLKDRSAELAHRNNLALAMQSLGDLNKAIANYQLALEISRELENQQFEGNSLGNLGSSYIALGQVEKAIEYLQKALAIAQKLEDKTAEQSYLRRLGAIQADIGEAEGAVEYLQQALNIAREIGDVSAESDVLGNLAIAYGNLGNFSQANSFAQEALSKSRNLGNLRGEASHLMTLGQVYLQNNQIEDAYIYFAQCLEISRKIGDRPSEAVATNNMAQIKLSTSTGDRSKNLEQAIIFLQTSLGFYDRSVYPEQWEISTVRLANAYTERIRGDRADNIEQAISLYQQVLEGDLRETRPLQWATTMMNLANAYRNRIRGDRADNIEQAIALYQQALDIITRHGMPIEWGTITMNLATAYSERIRGERAENIEQAIALYQQVVEIRRRETTPIEWAQTMSNLARSYSERIRGDRANNIEQAIDYYQQSLEVMTKQVMPIEWATIMMNLANAYSDRIRGNRAENIEQAIGYYQQALQIRTRQAMPVEWAQTMFNLANTYSDRVRGDRADNIEQAIAYYQQALEVMTRQAMPIEWAQTQNNLANAYSDRVRGDRAENIEQAIAYYQQALEVMTRQTMPIEWAQTMSNLAKSYSERSQGERAENIEQAIALYRNAFEVITRQSIPIEWATTMVNLGNAYSERIRGERVDNIEQAITCYQEAREIYTQKTFPEQWINATYNLALTYSKQERGGKTKNLQKAIQLTEDLLAFSKSINSSSTDEVRQLLNKITSESEASTKSVNQSISIGGNVGGNVNIAGGDIIGVGNVVGSAGVAIGKNDLNRIEPETVIIPEGDHLVASSQSQQLIHLLTYQICKYPITVGQYRHFVDEGGYLDTRYWYPKGWDWRSRENINFPHGWNDEKLSGNDNLPTVGISWYEASAYAQWLSTITGKTWRLPNEPEWEKAAKGQDSRKYPWGNTIASSFSNAGNTIGSTTHVDRYPQGASVYGVFDMVGNVWEWCLNDFDDILSSDPNSDNYRALRGGSWNTALENATVSSRQHEKPTQRRLDVGFRLLLSSE